MVDAVPTAHVLSISYNGARANDKLGASDIYVAAEYILSDLLQANRWTEQVLPCGFGWSLLWGLSHQTIMQIMRIVCSTKSRVGRFPKLGHF